MGIAYRLMYAVGFSPWDGPVPDPLKDMIEGPNALPTGRALDLGCGKGTKSVYMATNGWDVTGVDFVARALQEAQRRAQAAGVKIDFRQGDVTKLAAATRFCSILGATTGSNASSGPATRKA